MKRFGLTLLFAAAVADNHDQGAGDDSFIDGVGGWFSDQQEPVAFDSINIAGNGCKLNGAYGWFQFTGMEQIFIRNNVHGCVIGDSSWVLTWVEMHDVDNPGNIEGHFCKTIYKQGDAAGNLFDLSVQTQTGPGIDYNSWYSIPSSKWCDGSQEALFNDIDCTRQETWSQWRTLLDASENYPSSFDSGISAAACSASRALSTTNNYFEIKLGSPYSVTTGYMVYADENAFNSGNVQSGFYGKGSDIEMQFEAATALAAGVALLSAALFA